MRSWLVLAFAMVVGLTACSRKSKPPSTATSPPETRLPANCREISLTETEALLKTKPELVILDMRVETEWGEEGHIQGARFANYYRQDLKGYLSALDRTKPYFVYCAIGERSKQTAVQMAELGFKEIYVLAGGLNAWKAAGKPVVK
jgi:rhodanese-related sulfurtransferase